jgi:hypothetical protein
MRPITTRPPDCSEGRGRTCDILVNSQALLPLNYLGISSSPRQELHPRHLVYKTSALLAELHGQDLWSPRRELNSSLQFTKLMRDHRAARAKILERVAGLEPRGLRIGNAALYR